MSKMKLPGFTAEAALSMAGGQYRMDGNYEGPENADRILPQVPIRYCYKPETCIFRCCTTTIDYEGPYKIPVVRTTCDPDSWICGHRKPDAGVFLDL
jgi:hypothetical protein